MNREAQLIELVLLDADTAERAQREGVLAEFVDTDLRALGERIIARRGSAVLFDPGELLAELPTAMRERVVAWLSGGDAQMLKAAGSEWFEQRARQRDKAERQSLIAQLRQAEHRGDQEAIEAVLEALRFEARARVEAKRES